MTRQQVPPVLPVQRRATLWSWGVLGSLALFAPGMGLAQTVPCPEPAAASTTPVLTTTQNMALPASPSSAAAPLRVTPSSPPLSSGASERVGEVTAQAPASGASRAPAPPVPPARANNTSLPPSDVTPRQRVDSPVIPASSATASPPPTAQQVLEQLGAAIGAGLKDARLLQEEAMMARRAGDLSQAIRLLTDALSAAKAQALKPGAEAALMVDLGDTLAEAGEVERGVALLEAARQISAQAGEQNVQLQALSKLGREQALAGELRSARRTFEDALTVLKQAPSPAIEQSIRLELTDIYLKQGMSDAALEQLLSLEKSTVASTERTLRAHILQRVAWILLEKNDPEAARTRLVETLQLFRQAGDRTGEAQALDALALSLRQSGALREAAARRDQAAQVWASIPLERQALLSLAAGAEALELAGQYNEALPLLEKALSKAIQEGLETDAAALRARLGVLFDTVGNIEQAVKYLMASRSVRSKPGQPGAWIASLGLARIHSRQGRIDADTFYQEALDLIDRDNASYSMTEVDAPWLSSRLQAYEEGILRALHSGEPERAFELAERLRVRRFRDLEQSRERAASLESWGKGRGITLLGSGPSRQEIEERVEEVLEGLAPTDLQTSTIRMPLWNAKRALQFARNNQTTLVAYTALSKYYVVWVLTPDGRVEVKELPIERSRIEEWQQLLLNRLQAEPTTPRSGSSRASNVVGTQKSSLTSVQKLDRDTYTLLRDLYNALIAPVAVYLPSQGSQRIAMVTGERLLALPFGMLLDSEGDPLLKRSPILTAPVTAMLEPLYVRRNIIWVGKAELFLMGEGRRDAFSVGYEPLAPLDQRLKTGVFKSYLDSYNVRTDINATDGAVVNALKRPTAVQLSTRGFFHRGQPWLGGVIFSRTGDVSEEDGVLTVAELPFGQLQARVLVMPVHDGAEALGERLAPYSMGWLGAGAQSLVFPLGRTGLTGELADGFYAGLLKGLAPADALREAQLQALSRGEAFRKAAGLVFLGAL